MKNTARVLVSLAVAICSIGAASAQGRPNVLFIMSDDHAEQAISAYGSELIETPNIDRLAREGMLFRNAFVTNSICGPSRAVLLSGKYSHLNGLRDNRDEFDGSQQTFPKLLQKAGYQTGMVGKWHLKTEPTGFDYWKILVGQGEYYNPDFIDASGQKRHEGYVTTLTTDFALEFLEGRDRDRPFALLYHHKAPHRNWMPDMKHLEMYADEDIPLPPTFWDDYHGRPAAAAADMRIDDMFLGMDMKLRQKTFGEETGTGGAAGANLPFPLGQLGEMSYARLTPEQREAWDAHYGSINEAFAADRPEGRALSEWKYQRYMKDYLRCIASVDENIGRVLDYLDENGLADNTIVVYTSDQGFYLGEHGWYDKRFMYEESLGTPLIVRYPGEIPAGQVSEDLVLNLDFAPTFLDYAGVEIPEDLQGRSLRQVAAGDTPEGWRTDFYYRYYEFPHGWHSVRPHYGVRTERYKLIRFQGDMDYWELFDLQADPREVNNLYDREGFDDVKAKLHARLEALQTQVGDSPDAD